jgi:hypothetical protein
MDKESLFKAADIGAALDQFAKSLEGQYLYSRARQDIRDALYELKDCDPSDAKKIMAIQGRIRTAENFQSWISEGILEGMQAQQQLEDGFDPEGFEIEPQDNQ